MQNSISTCHQSKIGLMRIPCYILPLLWRLGDLGRWFAFISPSGLAAFGGSYRTLPYGNSEVRKSKCLERLPPQPVCHAGTVAPLVRAPRRASLASSLLIQQRAFADASSMPGRCQGQRQKDELGWGIGCCHYGSSAWRGVGCASMSCPPYLPYHQGPPPRDSHHGPPKL